MHIRWKCLALCCMLFLAIWILLPSKSEEIIYDNERKIVESAAAVSAAKWVLGEDHPLSIIKRDCGDLCNTTRKGFPGPYFEYVTAPVNCKALFKNEYIDRNHGLPSAPKQIPIELLDEFTMQKRVPVQYKYFDELKFDKRN